MTNNKDRDLAENIAMVVITLMAIGTVFVFSAGSNIAREMDLRRFYDFPGFRQILFFPLAIAILYTVSRFDYRKLSPTESWKRSPALYLLILCISLLILVLIPRFGTEINQARRWLRLPVGPVSISFQPSEFAKWTMIIFLAGFCDKYSSKLNLYWNKFIPLCSIIALTAGLVLIEDFGTAALISLLSLLIMIIAGVRLRHILTLVPFGLAAFCAALFTSPTRMKRIAAFLTPAQWADSAAYQANQSLIALGSGGLLGRGLGRGICKYGHLPEDTTDFIFAIIGEEFGLVGTTAVISLFVLFVFLGIQVVRRCDDPFGRILAAGIVLAISVQAALNIGVVTVVLPTKGIPLPFVSAGGTSMLLSAAAVGVLMSIAKQNSRRESLEITADE